MPGLFGVVRVDPSRRLPTDVAVRALDGMAKLLSHDPGYRRDAHGDAGTGFIVERIGYPHHGPIPWPVATEPGGATPAFYCGFVRDREAARRSAQSHLSRTSWVNSTSLLAEHRGSFAIVLRSAEPERTLVGVDRMGSWPIYYAVADGMLFFAPEVKALLVAIAGREFDWCNLSFFWSTGRSLPDRSLFREIKRLPGGSYLVVEDGRVSVHRYWRFTPGTRPPDRRLSEIADDVSRRISGAVSRDLEQGESTALMLSGGVDSRVILGAAYHALAREGGRIHTVTWGSDPARVNSDLWVARRIAASLALNHREFTIEIDGYGPEFRRLNYLIDGQSQVAAEHHHGPTLARRLFASGFVRVLRGDHAFSEREDRASTIEALLPSLLGRFRDDLTLATVFTPPARMRLVEGSEELLAEMIEDAAGVDPGPFARRLEFEHYQFGYLNFAAYYKQVVLDHRNPLLDEDLLDTVEQLPPTLSRDQLHPILIQRSFPELSRFPFSQAPAIDYWETIVSSDGPVRRYLLDEWSDTGSGVWGYLDREVLGTLLHGRSRDTPARIRSWTARILRKTASTRAIPEGLRILSSRFLLELGPHRIVQRRHQILRRFLVFKHWIDTFVDQRGDRYCPEERS